MKQNTPDEQALDRLVDDLAVLTGSKESADRAVRAAMVDDRPVQDLAKPKASRRVVPMVPKMHSYQFKILSLLQSKPIYQGTVSERTGSAGRAKRRAAGKAQKAARRANRR